MDGSEARETGLSNQFGFTGQEIEVEEYEVMLEDKMRDTLTTLSWSQQMEPHRLDARECI